MKIANVPLLDTPVPMDAAIELPAFYVGNIINYSVQLFFTASPTGAWKLQCSNDAGQYPTPARLLQTDTLLTWTDIAFSSEDITEAGTHVWNVQNCGYMWARAVWTPSAPGGTLVSARLNTKGA